jgi:hypothetical protein
MGIRCHVVASSIRRTRWVITPRGRRSTVASTSGGGGPSLIRPLDVGSGPATQERSLPARKNSGEITGPDARSSVTDAVDAAVLADQCSDLQPRPDLVGRHALLQQVLPRDPTVRGRSNPIEDPLH